MKVTKLGTLPIPDDHTSSAGAFAFDDPTSRLVSCGFYGSWSVFDTDSWEPIRSGTGPLSSVSVAQFTDDGLYLFGTTQARSSSKPPDWHAEIHHADHYADHRADPEQTSRVYALPPGRWQMVRNWRGSRIVVYDDTYRAGVHGWSPHAPPWVSPIRDVKKVVTAAGGRLLCLTPDRIVALSDDGAHLSTLPLPHAERFAWTTVWEMRDRSLALGGYNLETYNYAVTRIRGGRRSGIAPLEWPLRSVFSPESVEVILDEPCCDPDLFHVARIQEWSGGRLLLGLGGSGESLGACTGASALAVVDPADPGRWQTEVVEEEEGICGMLLVDADRLILSFCDDLCFYRLSDQ